MKGILLSLGILIPTILPSQIRLAPFPEIFSTYIGAHLSKRQFCLRPLSRGLFSKYYEPVVNAVKTISFRPLFRGLFFNSVPAKPQPVCSRKRICGGDGGDRFIRHSPSEMKCRFSQAGRASAGIDHEE